MAAPQSEREVGDGGKGEVSSCVTNLIHAFTNGLDIFKRLRQRRRKRKARKQSPVEEISNDEIQLSNSLRRGPRDIEDCYVGHYGKAGDRFAKGDPIAHASLAETLIKLNTGLVNIIAAFLNHDRKSSNLNLDYKSLTNLSNASRAEAIGSLNQLYQRLSQSQIHLSHQGRVCPRCKRTTISKHHDCSQDIRHGGGRSDKRSRPNSRTRSNGPTVARLPIKSSSQTQLVVVRPRNPRKNSATSTKSHSAATTAVNTAAPPSSVLQYSKNDQPRPSNFPTPIAQPAGRRRSSSVDGPRPTTWPQPKLETTIRLQAPPAKPPGNTAVVHRDVTPSSPLPIKRRADKVTPSTFTFASDSTKLGEIPEKNWIQPFDYAEADRLNAEALANWTPAAGGERAKPKKGLFSFLRRGTAMAS